MDKTRDILRSVQNGSLSVEDAVLALKLAPFEDLGYAKVDHHRSLRQGAAEVIYGAGKTPAQIAGILEAMRRHGDKTILVTRLSPESAEILKKEFPGMKIIMATSALEQSWWEQARDTGVESFWYKAYAKLSLLEIMDRTMDGEHVYTNEDRDAMLGDLPVSELTPQQRNVLRELTRGRNNREIGERLCIEESTVRYHLEEIMRKAGIHSRVELAVKASRANIVVSDEDRLNGMGN